MTMMSGEEVVTVEQYSALLQLLEDERIKHAETKQKLMEAEDKLEYANGEIEILQKQIQREKKQFDQAFQTLKQKALTESSKNVELENKCFNFEQEREDKLEHLSQKQSKIQNLTQQLQTQQTLYEREVLEMNIQLQQEAYIAKELGHKSTDTNKIHSKASHPVRSLAGTDVREKTKGPFTESKFLSQAKRI